MISMRSVQDTRLMKSAGTVSISQALRSFTVAAFGTVLMFMTSATLTGLTLLCLPPLLAAFHVFARLNKRFTQEGLTASAAASVVSEETFGSIRTVCTASLACLPGTLPAGGGLPSGSSAVFNVSRPAHVGRHVARAQAASLKAERYAKLSLWCRSLMLH